MTEAFGDQPVVFRDEHGRRVTVSRDEYARKILPATLAQVWSSPDQMYALILRAVQDGFAPEVDEASRYLMISDPIPQRGVVVRSVVLRKTGRSVEAEKLLRQFLNDRGPDATLLVNLAQAVSDRGSDAEARELLNDALSLDPNQEVAVEWIAAAANDRGGVKAMATAMKELAHHFGGWQAPLFAARHLLLEGHNEEAVPFVEAALAADPDGLTLFSLTSSLGNAGLLQLMIDTVGPRFDPERHDIRVGFNLVRACIDTNQRDRGTELLGQLQPVAGPLYSGELAHLKQELRG